MKLVILDRDGTINHDSEHYIKSLDEWRPIKGSIEAIARLTQADYRVVVATNQSGISRGLFTTRTLFEMHDALQRLKSPVNPALGRGPVGKLRDREQHTGQECRRGLVVCERGSVVGANRD